MSFEKHRALIRLSTLILIGSLVSGCVSAPPILSTPTACSTLLPTEWREGVQGVDLPQGSTVGDWIAFADAQTGQLDKSNDRYNAAVGIVERCEERDKQAVQRARPRFLGVF